MAGKNNVDYYPHHVASHNEWRFKTLRRKFGWAGEGRFYALVNMIGQEDGCRLLLDTEEKLYQYAADLDLDVEELREFLEYLVKPCKLLLRDEDGALRYEDTDRALEEVSHKRKRQREWKREKSTEAKIAELPESRPSTAAESTVENEQRRVKESKGEKGELESLEKNQSLQDTLAATAAREKAGEEDKGTAETPTPLPTTPSEAPDPGSPAAPPRTASGKFAPKTAKKTAPGEKKPTKSEEARPGWQMFVQTWFDYNLATARVEPSFAGRDPRYLGEIYDRLKLRSERKAPPVPWTEETASAALKSFLTAADLHEWLTLNFQLKYLLEKFDTVVNLAKDGTKQTGPRVNYEQEVRIFYQAFFEGRFDKKAIKAEHYPPLAELHPVSEELIERAKQIRAKKLEGTNDGRLLRIMTAYRAGDINQDTESDFPVVLGMARRLAVLEYFEEQKAAGNPEILSNKPPQLRAV